MDTPTIKRSEVWFMHPAQSPKQVRHNAQAYGVKFYAYGEDADEEVRETSSQRIVCTVAYLIDDREAA